LTTVLKIHIKSIVSDFKDYVSSIFFEGKISNC